MAAFFWDAEYGIYRMNNRSVIYIDGFNLYYGALRGSADKWLDLAEYFRLLRTDDDIQRIRYFTARVNRPDQNAYLEAIQTNPLVVTEFGLFKQKKMRCHVKSCLHTGSREYAAMEEKGTDVNIALRMLDDAYQGICDRIILVSGDSDLVPTVRLIKQRFPKIRITVYVPARDKIRGAARELRNAADKHLTLPLGLLAKAQFPVSITKADGNIIMKPPSW